LCFCPSEKKKEKREEETMATGKHSKFFLTPAFKAIIAESSRQIFGNLPVVNYRTGFKVLRQKPTGPLAVNHYIKDMTRGFKLAAPEFKTDLEERRIEQLARFRRRGKGPPKKGEGRRNQKKK